MRIHRSILLLLSIFATVAGCSLFDSAQTDPGTSAPSSPTPSSPSSVVVTPPSTTPAVEPFCPYKPVEQLRLTEARPGVFQISFDVALAANGSWLHNYQVEVQRAGTFHSYFNAQADKLSGPDNKRATVEWTFPGIDPGPLAVRVRAQFPNECHDDGNGNLRLNGEWTDYVKNDR